MLLSDKWKIYGKLELLLCNSVFICFYWCCFLIGRLWVNYWDFGLFGYIFCEMVYVCLLFGVIRFSW